MKSSERPYRAVVRARRKLAEEMTHHTDGEERGRTVVWNEPLCLDEDCVINSVVRAEEADVIRYYRHVFPERNDTDEEALYEFMLVHWAWFEEAAPHGKTRTKTKDR